MTAAELDYDPTDLDAQDERLDERRRAVAAAQLARRDEMCWLMSSRIGRRRIRNQLRDAGFDVASDDVPTSFTSDASLMAYREARRHAALEVIWPLVRAVARGDLPLDALTALVKEQDE